MNSVSGSNNICPLYVSDLSKYQLAISLTEKN